MHVLHVVGARPNFMKVAPVIRAFNRRKPVRQTLVHTGQHYDAAMSDIFFEQLELPRPDVCLDVRGGTHAVQTAQIMVRFEPVLLERKPDIVLVYGDVNSTLSAALVCAKLHVPLAHVEAGLRSFQRTMPEEINRIVTDRISNILFTPSADGDANLLREGIDPQRIVRVGNVMIDTLVRLLPRARLPEIEAVRERFVLVTVHRPSNVDDPAMLAKILDALIDISRKCRIVFPVHPRTRARIEQLGLDLSGTAMTLLDPVGYLECLALQKHACMVLTDSGGIQEETTYLGTPCLTLRESTERPVTVEVGTNILVGQDMQRLRQEVDRILAGNPKPGKVPELWDSQAGERIADYVVSCNRWKALESAA